MDDPDVEVVDEQDDLGARQCSADADVEELAVVAEGDLAGLVDAVVADAEGAAGVGVGSGFGAGGLGDGGGRVMRLLAVLAVAVLSLIHI